MNRSVLLLAIIASTALAGCAARQAAPAAIAQAAPQEPAQALAQAPALRATIGRFGFDDAGMDRTVAPGDDFYAYANGTWAKSTAIPDDKSNYGMFTLLDDLSKARVKDILDAARSDPSSKIGNAYAAYLDTATVEARGLAPIRPWLDEIRAVQSRADYAALLARAARNGVTGPFAGYVGQDDKKPDQYIFSMYQAGLGMPDRDFYLDPAAPMQKIRAAYLTHLATLFTLAGEPDGARRAAAILAFETRIARVHWTRVDSRDAEKTYNKLTLAQLTKTAPGFDFAAMMQAGGLHTAELLVAQPSAIRGTAALIARTPLNVLKDQMLVRSLDQLSDALPDALANTTFAFYGTVLSGTPQREERWKRGTNWVKGALGEELGREYVARHFPPETKAAADELVKNVLAAMGRRIDALPWMSAPAKTAARAKLAAFTTKIGYPDRWRDYSALEIRRDDLFGNTIRSNNFDYEENIGRLGQPIRRWEWGMTPMEINAYANFGMVEIVFPAAILQPPFFDPHADPAINYGGIGAVIGHEISHHFDDQGAKYDANGRLVQWWTQADIAAFKALTDQLVQQYDAYEPLPGVNVNGKLTLGENIADLAGLTVAYEAYKAALGGKEAPVIDGTTGDQRFYLGWAQVWRRNYREANLRQRLITDPHSPSAQRVAVVRNLDPWYGAFAIPATGRLALDPARRVRIW